MTRQAIITARLRRARLLRQALATMAVRRGRHLGYVLQRLAQAVYTMRPTNRPAGGMRPGGIGLFLSDRLNDLSDCGTGQAGGGGGSSGLVRL